MIRRLPKPPPRRYTAGETCHAIGRMLDADRPGGIGLACPEEIRDLFRRTPERPARLVLSAHQHVHHLRRWADALDGIKSITAEASAAGDGDVLIVVKGRIPRGPVIAIQAWVQDFPLSLIPADSRTMTLEELRALDGAL